MGSCLVGVGRSAWCTVRAPLLAHPSVSFLSLPRRLVSSQHPNPVMLIFCLTLCVLPSMKSSKSGFGSPVSLLECKLHESKAVLSCPCSNPACSPARPGTQPALTRWPSLDKWKTGPQALHDLSPAHWPRSSCPLPIAPSAPETPHTLLLPRAPGALTWHLSFCLPACLHGKLPTFGPVSALATSSVKLS